MFEIKNAKVHPGRITFIHAKAIDQGSELFEHLPAPKEIWTVAGSFVKQYVLETDNEEVSTVVLYLW